MKIGDTIVCLCRKEARGSRYALLKTAPHEDPHKVECWIEVGDKATIESIVSDVHCAACNTFHKAVIVRFRGIQTYNSGGMPNQLDWQACIPICQVKRFKGVE